jgi:alpha-L-fucosidase
MTKKTLKERMITMLLTSYLQEIDRVISSGKYRDTWASLAQHSPPGWYTGGKLGIFIHWGIYSVPAFGNEWYSRNMYDPGHREFEHHRKTYGDQKEFGYKDFIPMFKGERFDPAAWAELFCAAGARFVMPVSEHHDGFAMYKTAFNPWNAADMGPCRDVIAELKCAAEQAGLRFCASNHRAEHYFFMNMGRTFDSDINDPAFADFYGPAVYLPEFDDRSLYNTTESPAGTPPTEEWLTDWMVRVCEFIDRYRPHVLYFDWWIQNYAFKPYLKKIAAYYYNRAEEWGEEVTINYKWEAFAPGTATYDVERGALGGISPAPWQTCTAIGKNSWGYTADNVFKSPRQIICDLIDIVSKNGILLLNVGPRADGTITEEETHVLLELGRWLRINGEGIYGTTPWRTFGEGSVNRQTGAFIDGDENEYTAEDFRFTYKAGAVYAMQMRPDGRDALIRSFSANGIHDFGIETVELLGYDGPLTYTRDRDGLRIILPADAATDYPLCFRITLQ